jgi:hypothetical protein
MYAPVVAWHNNTENAGKVPGVSAFSTIVVKVVKTLRR